MNALARLLTLLIAVALATACTSDPERSQANPPTSTGSTVDTSTPVASILEPLDGDEIEAFSDDEQFLVSLLISPRAIEGEHMVNVVQVDDPNGNAEIGDRWYEPRLRVSDCAFSTDQAPMPIVEAGYVPGDPNESTTSAPFAVISAPYQLGSRIQLFDTREQRDSFAAVMGQASVAARDLECPTTSLFPEVVEFTPTDIGYPGYGFRTTPPFGTGGDSLSVQHLIGDRVLLTSSLGSAGMSDEPAAVLELSTLESFVELQVARLKANGFG